MLALIEFFLFFNRLFPAQVISNDLLCKIQACLNEFLSLVNIFWIGYLKFEMYNVVIRKKQKLQFGYYKPLILFVAISLFGALFPWSLGIYGKAEFFCWIRSSNSQNYAIFNLVFFYAFLWIIILFVIFSSIKVSNSLRNMITDDKIILVKRIQNYPLTLIVLYAPMTICRFIQSYVVIPEWFFMFSISCILCEGIFNAVIFGYTPELKERFHILRSKIWNIKIDDIDQISCQISLQGKENSLR